MNLQALISRADELRKELQELETAIRVIRRYEVDGTNGRGPEPAEPESDANSEKDADAAKDSDSDTDSQASDLFSHRPSAKQAIIDLLRVRKTIHKAQIIPTLQREFGITITRNTLTSTLSKNKEIFRSNGSGVWTLVEPPPL